MQDERAVYAENVLCTSRSDSTSVPRTSRSARAGSASDGKRCQTPTFNALTVNLEPPSVDPHRFCSWSVDHRALVAASPEKPPPPVPTRHETTLLHPTYRDHRRPLRPTTAASPGATPKSAPQLGISTGSRAGRLITGNWWRHRPSSPRHQFPLGAQPPPTTPHTGIAGTPVTDNRGQRRPNAEIRTLTVDPHPFWTPRTSAYPQNECGSDSSIV